MDIRRCEGEDFSGVKGAVGEIPGREEQEGQDMMKLGQNLSRLHE